MRKKGSVNIALVVWIVVMAGVVWYFVLNQQVPSRAPTPTSGGTVTIRPEDPAKTGLAPYPDEPSAAPLPTPMSVTYLIEHRSALNDKVVTVRGIVVTDWRDGSKCPSGVELLCPQPVIFLADTASADRNPQYDLLVRLSEDDHSSYRLGQIAEIRGTVYGHETVVQLTKNY